MRHQIVKSNHFARLALLIFICLSALTSWAQSGRLFNTDNQLSSSFATQVIVDHKGFIWIATRNGLNMYDGYRFTIFNKDKKDNRGFSNNYINSLGEDHQGNIIMGTNNGIMVYDGKEFHNLLMKRNGKTVKSYINYIFTRKNGEVWICTSGYGMMRINKDYTECNNLGGPLLPYHYLYSATEDHQGRVWITTEGLKLMRLEKNGKLTKHIAGTENLKVKRIVEDKRGNIYLGTERQGIYVQKAGTAQFVHINNTDIPNIEYLYISKKGLLYVGSNGGGISIYNPYTGTLTQHPFFSSQIDLYKAKVNSIIEDKQGNIWMSMLQKGVFMQSNKKGDFGYMGYRLGKYNLIGDNCVTSVLQTPNGKIWVGTDKDGLYSLNNSMPSMAQHFTQVPSTILALCADKKGNIWMGTYREGLGYLDPAGNFHYVDFKLGSSLSVFDIKCDPQGNLWFATMGNGLILLRPNGSMKVYQVTGGSDGNENVNHLANNYLTKMNFSRDYSKLYIATSIGLCCLDLKTDSWTSTFGKNCLNKGSFSHCVLSDTKGNVWYGTEEGIYVYNLKDLQHPRRYTISNGLSSNCVAFLAEDGKGHIWAGTTHGLNCIIPETGNIRTFYVENGLQSNEFSDGAVFTADGGKKILMGGTGGINWFYPLTMKHNQWDAKVMISNFIVANTNIYVGQESGVYTITTKPICDSPRFDLSHDDNSFSLQLSTLTYNNVEQISFSYSINNEDWVSLQPGQNEISFSHLAPGTYKFKVKAMSNGEETPVKEFTIVIHPAWYASFWARLVYLMAFLGLCGLYFQHRKRKEEDRLQLQKHIHAEEMGEAKLRFFMNISHEIRTPLTLIITPLLSLIKEDKDPHRQSIYDMIRKNSERILHLINQMMDLRKIDKGQMVMHMCDTDMVSFIQDEYELFRQQAIAKSIDFMFDHDSDNLSVWIDRNNFDKVLMNVLSNAFKFTPTAGKILITLTHTDHHAYISIKDNGQGIPKDKLETIFQRFYQSPTTANDRNIGTGIGLDLTRSLVELHYGTIVARNNQGLPGSDFEHGSEFIIRLPLGCEHLKPEEMVTDVQEEKLEEITKEEQETPEEEIGIESTESPIKSSTTKAKIAVVEDDEAILEYLKAQLSADFNTLTYPNGKVALPEIIKQQPDLVISDIMMPEMDGNTLCTKLKNNVNTNHIPVILLTAMSREEDQLAGLQTGADAYIVKPFNMDILRRTILNLLSVHRTLRNKFTGMESQEGKLQEVEMDSPDKQLLDRIMAVINDNMSDSDLSVDMIAQKVGISRVHLHRKMKELTNQTPHSFIRNVRLKQAAKLLKDSRQSITEVMYVCGFSNPASFSTMFKNMYGCSPRDYMNQEHNS